MRVQNIIIANTLNGPKKIDPFHQCQKPLHVTLAKRTGRLFHFRLYRYLLLAARPCFVTTGTVHKSCTNLVQILYKSCINCRVYLIRQTHSIPFYTAVPVVVVCFCDFGLRLCCHSLNVSQQLRLCLYCVFCDYIDAFVLLTCANDVVAIILQGQIETQVGGNQQQDMQHVKSELFRIVTVMLLSFAKGDAICFAHVHVLLTINTHMRTF